MIYEFNLVNNMLTKVHADSFAKRLCRSPLAQSQQQQLPMQGTERKICAKGKIFQKKRVISSKLKTRKYY